MDSKKNDRKCMIFVTMCPNFARLCDLECRVVYYCEPGQKFDASAHYRPDVKAYADLDEKQYSGFKFRSFTNAITGMQQRARHYRNYVDFPTAARYITEDVAS
eukprot:2444690-Karenia_brevis.AAC.1